MIIAWLTLAAFLAWFILYWRGGGRIAADLHKAAASRLDQGLIAVITLCSFLLAGLGLLASLGLMGIVWPPTAVALLGLTLTVGGIGGMFYARSLLGQFWTAETAVQPDHQIIDSGLYGRARHPIYSFAMLMYIGIGLVFASWWAGALTAVIVLAYIGKTALEDQFLRQNLPGYTAYARRVPYRLLPGVW